VTLLLFVGGLILLVAGAELLVRGASRIAALAGISPLVVGLTVVAFGTSAPELAVSSVASLRGDADIAVGNVVGSNIFNVLFILGVSALVAPLVVSRQLVREQVPLMIGVSVFLWLLALDGSVVRPEGGLLFAGIVAYTGVLIVRSRREGPARPEPETGGAARHEPGAVVAAGAQPVASDVAVSARRRPLVSILSVLAGLALLIVGSGWLVEAARSIAGALGVSDLVIGLTVVAAGTSFPELATSVVASIRGEREIAVGNIVGSNVFNILGILGVSALLAPAGLEVAPAARSFDVPVMVAVAVACLPVFVDGRILRWEGGVFAMYYGAYLTYLVLDVSGHQALPQFRAAVLGFVLPLTALTFAVVTWRALRSRRP